MVVKIKKISMRTPTFKIPQYATIKQKKKPRQTISLSKPRQFNKKLKSLNTKQAMTKFNLAPFGDIDKDHVLNAFDCRPFDYKKHAVPEEYADEPVFSYRAGQETMRDTFARAEKRYPNIFKAGTYKDGQSIEDDISQKFSESLIVRQRRSRRFEDDYIEQAPPPLKSIVGIYKIPINFDKTERNLAHDILIDWLRQNGPPRTYTPDPKDPTQVQIIDHNPDIFRKRLAGQLFRKGYQQLTPEEKAEVERNVSAQTQKGSKTTMKFGKLLNQLNAPSHIIDLLSCFDSSKPVTILITDDPVDVLMQSTQPRDKTIHPKKILQARWDDYENPYTTFTSCHKLGSMHEEGAFCDVESMNAIAFVYFGDKKPEEDPASGRITIRWGYNEDGAIDVHLESDIYPWSKLNKSSMNRTILKGRALKHSIKRILQEKGLFLGTIEMQDLDEQYSDWRNNEGSSEVDPDSSYFSPVRIPPLVGTLDEKKREYLSMIDEDEKIPDPFWKTFSRDPNPKVRRRTLELNQRVESSELFPHFYDEATRNPLLSRPTLLSDNPDIYHKAAREGSTRDRITLLEIDEEEEEKLRQKGKTKSPPPELYEHLFEEKQAAESLFTQPYAGEKHFRYVLGQPYAKELSDEKLQYAAMRKISPPTMSRLIKIGGPETRRAVMRRHSSSLSPTTRKGLLKFPNTHYTFQTFMPNLTQDEINELALSPDVPTQRDIIHEHHDQLTNKTIRKLIRSPLDGSMKAKVSLLARRIPSIEDVLYLLSLDQKQIYPPAYNEMISIIVTEYVLEENIHEVYPILEKILSKKHNYETELFKKILAACANYSTYPQYKKLLSLIYKQAEREPDMVKALKQTPPLPNLDEKDVAKMREVVSSSPSSGGFKVGDKVRIKEGVERYAITRPGSYGVITRFTDYRPHVKFVHTTGDRTLEENPAFDIYEEDLEHYDY